MGGFTAFLLVITYSLVKVLAAASLKSFLVSSIFLKRHNGLGITKINLNWTTLAKRCHKSDYMTRAKGMKRVEEQIDVVKLIRKFFVLDQVIKHLISPE